MFEASQDISNISNRIQTLFLSIDILLSLWMKLYIIIFNYL